MCIVDWKTIKLSIGSAADRFAWIYVRAGGGGAWTFALAREHEYTDTNHEAKGLLLPVKVERVAVFGRSDPEQPQKGSITGLGHPANDY